MKRSISFRESCVWMLLAVPAALWAGAGTPEEEHTFNVEAKASASAGGPLDRKAMDKRAKEWDRRARAAVDVEIEIPVPVKPGMCTGSESTSSTSASLPDGWLIMFTTGSGGVLRVQFGLLPASGDTSWRTLGAVLADPRLKAAYEAINGDGSLAKAMAGASASDPAANWLSDGEMMALRRVAGFFGPQVSLAPERLAELRRLLAAERQDFLALGAAYRACRGKTASGAEKQALVLAYQKAEASRELLSVFWRPAPVAPPAFHGEGDWRAEVKTSDAGRTTIAIRFSNLSAGLALEKFLAAVPDDGSGQATTCTMDPQLASKTLRGELTVYSVKEGLDQIAKLAGGRLVKDGNGWRIAPR